MTSQSAFYFAKSEKLTKKLKCTIHKNEQAKKEKVLQEQIELYLQAVVKEVNEEDTDPMTAYLCGRYVERVETEATAATDAFSYSELDSDNSGGSDQEHFDDFDEDDEAFDADRERSDS